MTLFLRSSRVICGALSDAMWTEYCVEDSVEDILQPQEP